MKELRAAERFSEQQFIQQQADLTQNLTPAQQFTADSFTERPAADEQVPTTTPVTASAENSSGRTSCWLWGSAVALVVLLAGLQWYDFVLSAWQQSYLQGAAASGLTLAGGWLLLGGGFNAWRHRRRAAELTALRADAAVLQASLQYGQAGSWLKRATAWLPQQAAQGFALDPLLSDAEQLGLFERQVLAQLDQSAEKLVRQAAGQTCLAVAVSPFALADLALVSWRGLRLVREIGELYGVRLTLWQRGSLIKAFLQALFWTGSSELALDLAGDALGAELSSKVSARAGQGVLAGLLLARLGHYAISEFRPIGFVAAPDTSKLLLGQLLQQLLQQKKNG